MHEKGTMTLGRERVDVCLSCTTWQGLALWGREHDPESPEVESVEVPPRAAVSVRRGESRNGFCW